MKFIIKGRLDGLNKVIEQNRTNKYAGNELKKTNQRIVKSYIPKELCERDMKYPVSIHLTFYEPNNRRDVDNVISSQKFILDAMVQKKVIPNDSRKYVSQVISTVFTDKDNPRIVVEIKEGE